MIQVTAAKYAQADVYKDINPRQCLVELSPTDMGSSVRYDVYEPVGAMTTYLIYERVDVAGLCEVKQRCTGSERCKGFLYMVRDGVGYLLDIKTSAINLELREPAGSPTKALFRLYIKVPEGSVNKHIQEKDYQFLPLDFQKVSDTRVRDAPMVAVEEGVVISMTTIPSRIDELRDTLTSLLHQTVKPEKIYVNVPRNSSREIQHEYHVPDWLRRMEGVEVVTVPVDYGPSTKLLPTVQVSDATIIIVVINDNIIIIISNSTNSGNSSSSSL